MSEFLTTAQLCARLQVTKYALQALRQDPVDPLPCVKLGRMVRYPVDQVEAWLKRQAERTAPQRRAARRAHAAL